MYILSSTSRGGWPRIIEGNEHRGGNSRERGKGHGKGGGRDGPMGDQAIHHAPTQPHTSGGFYRPKTFRAVSPDIPGFNASTE